MMESVISDDGIRNINLSLEEDKVAPEAKNSISTLMLVDDDSVNRIVLKGMLTKYGYNVLVADDGHKAVEMSKKYQPDLILMDVMMPVMDGYEAAELIKKDSPDTYTPIMFLTAITDEDALAKCVESGGDDFLSKPYSPVILKAKIEALLRMKELYREKQVQYEVLSFREEEAASDLDIAERILSKITKSEAFDVTNINYYLSPMEQLNGDIIIVSHKPDGGQLYMLGDFTGHGLGAAIGGLVVFDVFKTMAAKGFSVAQIISEINRKLREVLPTGRFLAAGFVELDAEHTIASVWNGGLPDIYFKNSQTGITHNYPSLHLPLGVVESHELDLMTETIRLAHGDQFILYSDGLIEGENKSGDFFGSERLEECIASENSSKNIFPSIMSKIVEFCQGQPQRDDLSILEIYCDPTKTSLKEDKIVTKSLLPASSWSLDFCVKEDVIKQAEIIPSLVQMVVDIQGLHYYQKSLYLIMTELFSNALEHGLLDLDSSLKVTPDGFEQYYKARKNAIDGLSAGSITFNLKHSPCTEGGKLSLRITHDGDGFDVESAQALMDIGSEETVDLHGRGIKLVKSLTERLEYEDFGKTVEVDYIWKEE